MTEPTIDEMLEFLDRVHMNYHDKETEESKAIRAILEQHRDRCCGYRPELEAIRAFVERVEKDLEADGVTKDAFRIYVLAELAAMEKENDAS